MASTNPKKHRSAAGAALPPRSMPFVGREEELAEVAELLADPACRVLTLVGPGGIGKTRLAVEAAADVRDAGRRAVAFVPLETAATSDAAISAVTEALDLQLRGSEAAQVQLLNHLRGREMLLVLDGYERLLAPAGQGAASLVPEILRAAPNVKLLITSREALRLQDEWLYPLRGLDVPPGETSDNLEAFGAITLFVEQARRLHPGFSLADERAAVVQICQLVEGMPLALELAASWVKTLSCAEIAAEIERNRAAPATTDPDPLTTRLRDVPSRHRSMEAVFDQSWKLLTEEEQAVFCRLSVFRGGFDREAAQEVAGASVAALSALVDKSLLRRERGHRYQVHGLLRQYAAERLARSTEGAEGALAAHADYYVTFLRERRDALLGAGQPEAIAEIHAEVENIRQAWNWAVAYSEAELIRQAAHALANFCQFQGRYLEGLDALERAARVLEGPTPTKSVRLARASVQMEEGWFCIRLGRLEQAARVLKESQRSYDALDVPFPTGQGTDPALALGVLALTRGAYERAATLAKEARTSAQRQDHPWNLQIALYLLAQTAQAAGDYEVAQKYAQRAVATTEETGDRWFRAYCLNELGNVARAQGKYAAARQHYKASYDIRETFDDPEGMALALHYLGQVALADGDTVEADRFYAQSRDIYHEINDRGGLARAWAGLGGAALAAGDFEAARDHIHTALGLAAEIDFLPLVLSVVVQAGKLLLQTGHETRGVELLALALDHPAADRQLRERVEKRLSRQRPSGAAKGVPAGDLASAIAALQAELPALALAPAPDQPLVEPLTDRELEILALIAEGRANQEIADELILALSTVKWYTSQIYGKLQVSNRTEAAAQARELDLLP